MKLLDLAMRVSLILTGVMAGWLVACAHTRTGEPAAAPEPMPERARPELGCTERPTANDDETDECAAQGCRWGPALPCSGIERPPPPERFDDNGDPLVPAPSCACVCPEDIRDCMLRP